MIEYPHYFDGQTGVDGERLVARRPDMVVMDAEPLLARGSRVLDVGAGYGANGTHLALHGHIVHSVELNPDDLETGHRIIRALGGLAASNTMVLGDMRDLSFFEEFDAVITTRTLQLVTKPEAHQVIHKLREATKPGGLNIINAYVAKPDEQAHMPNFAFFQPAELPRLYRQAGWAIKDDESYYKMEDLAYAPSGKPVNFSQERLIARKPTAARAEARRLLISRAQIYRRSDPEHYDDLMEQASAL